MPGFLCGMGWGLNSGPHVWQRLPVCVSLQPHWAVCFLRGEAWGLDRKQLLHTAGATSSRSNGLLHRLRTLEPEDLYLNFYWKRSEAGKIVAFICERRIDTPKAYFCLSLLHLEAWIYTTFLM